MKKSVRRRCCLTATLLGMLLLPGPAAVTLAAGTPPAAQASGPKANLTAILLVAQDAVSDPNFAGSIVLVMNNLGPAPVGIILNRPMPVLVARFFPKLKRLAHSPDRAYYGGPVEFGEVWYLFRATTAPKTAIPVCQGVFVSADGPLLMKLLSRKQPMKGLRLFIGHAGWAPGQLQFEIDGGAWLPRRADANSIFDPRPLRPWPAAQEPRPGT